MRRVAHLIILTLLLTPTASQAIDQGYTNLKSSVTFNGPLIYKASSPVVLSSSNVNNYNWGTDPFLRSSATKSLNITGFSQPRDGITFMLINVSTNTITIVNGSTQSSSGNRITTDTGSDVAIGSGASKYFWYDAVSLVWRICK